MRLRTREYPRLLPRDLQLLTLPNLSSKDWVSTCCFLPRLVDHFLVSQFFRLLSSRGAGAVNAEFVQDYEESDNLNSRVFRLRQPKRSASNVPQRWVSEGNPISISDLRQISKDLSKSHLQTCRYPSGWSTIMDTYLMAPSLFQPRPNRLSAMSTGL
ncbi:hypothetical protein EV1_018225 [Malus domestica]